MDVRQEPSERVRQTPRQGSFFLRGRLLVNRSRLQASTRFRVRSIPLISSSESPFLRDQGEGHVAG